VIDALSQETSYGYDELGNRISQTDANGHTTWFVFDKLGRETARILPDGSRETKSYDAAGNLETRTDFLGRTTSYGYDAANRLLSRSYPDGSSVALTYTPNGRRASATVSLGAGGSSPSGSAIGALPGTTSYSYDLRDRLVSLSAPLPQGGGAGAAEAALAYGYDGNGNRTSLTATLPTSDGSGSPLVLTTTYSYDDAGRLDIVTDPAGRTYDFAHDPNGNRQEVVYPNGVVTSYGYSNLNRLTSLSTIHPASGRNIQSYAFTLGPAGNRTRIVESQGLPQQRTLDYSYDALYRLTGESVSESLGLVYSKAFAYDPVGNRQQQTTTLGPAGAPGPNLQPGTIAYGYDTRDRLLAETRAPNPATSYTFDTNGNLTSKDGEATYTWDHENRLIRVAKTDGTVVDYAYDADGNRVSTTTTPAGGGATTTAYLVDTSGSLSHVVAELSVPAPAAPPPTPSPALVALYIRGSDDLLSVMRPQVPAPAPSTPTDWQTRYYHADGIGSIRRLTDEAGSITDGCTYSAFGELLSHTGSDPQPYSFAGEPLDPNSGWQYHRARWMDPRVGRFAGVDTWTSNVFDPPTLHRYTYVRGDSPNRIDPSGLYEGLGGALTSLAINVTISTISSFGITYALTGDLDESLASARDGFYLGLILGGFSSLNALRQGLNAAVPTTLTSAARGVTGQRAVVAAVEARGETVLHEGLWYYISKSGRLIKGEVDILTDKALYEVKNYAWEKYNEYLLRRVEERFMRQIASRREFLTAMRGNWALSDDLPIVFRLSSGAPQRIVNFLRANGVLVEFF
jgi:RHS repeat-associated protein